MAAPSKGLRTRRGASSAKPASQTARPAQRSAAASLLSPSAMAAAWVGAGSGAPSDGGAPSTPPVPAPVPPVPRGVSRILRAQPRGHVVIVRAERPAVASVPRAKVTTRPKRSAVVRVPDPPEREWVDLTVIQSRPWERRPGLRIDPYYGTGRRSVYANRRDVAQYLAQHGFGSRAQWRWAFASKQPWARSAAHSTKGGPRVRYHRLPGHKPPKTP